MHNESLELEKLYKLIDLCKYASVDGEKLEIVLNSTVDNTREIFIGLSNGLSRDRYTFEFNNGVNFDSTVLPLIIKHFLDSDEVFSWDFQKSEIVVGSSKSLLKTKDGNEFLIQTYNDLLIDELKEKINEIKKNDVADKNIILTDGEKKCEDALAYVNDSIKNNAFLVGLTNEEKAVVLELLNDAYSIKSSYTDNELLEFISSRHEVATEFLNRIAANVVNNDSLTSKSESFNKLEKRFSKYKNDESFALRKKVAIYLAKIGYFDTRLNFPRGTDLEQLDNLDDTISKNSKSKYNVLLNAKVYFIENDMMEEVKVIDEFIDFLVKKQRKSYEKKKGNVKVKNNEEVVLTPVLRDLNKENIITDFSILADTFALCNGAKINNERVLVKVSNHDLDSSKRRVEISLMDGMSRDHYEYIFEDGSSFDKEILPRIISMVGAEQKVLSVESNNTELLNRDNILLSYEDGNQCLINVNGIKEDLINEFVKNSSDNVFRIDGSNSLEMNDEKEVKFVNVINNTAKNNSENSNNNVLESSSNVSLSHEQLMEMLEQEVLAYGFGIGKEENNSLEFADKFEKLHYFARKYQPLITVDGDLKIYDRETRLEYNPTSDSEREEIEFASFWASAAGISYSNGDVFPGETVAFSDNAKKLFNIMNVHFEESLKRGIDIDIEALNRQFINSGYNMSNVIFNRLFRDSECVEELVSYYRYQLQQNNDTLTNTFVDVVDNNVENTVVDNISISNEEKSEILSDKDFAFIESSYNQLTDLDEIKIAFEVASTYSNSDKPVSLKIFFPNEDKNKAQITISYGPTNDEDVLYQKTFDSNVVMNEFLPEICNIFVLQNGIVTNDTFRVPNTDKGGSITLGMNDSLLQMSNANMSDVFKLQTYLSDTMTKKNESYMKK